MGAVDWPVEVLGKETVGKHNDDREALEGLDFTPEPGFDCTKCGACCAPLENNPGQHYVELLHGDMINLGLDPERHSHLVIKHEGRCPNTSGYHLKVIPNKSPIRDYDEVRCPLLAGEVGRSALCTVYERRPYACKVFTPGDSGCINLRQQHWLAGNRGIHPRSTKVPPAVERRYKKAKKLEGDLVELKKQVDKKRVDDSESKAVRDVSRRIDRLT